MRNAADIAAPKFASMICAGPHASETAVFRSGMPSSMQNRKIPPITNAPITEPMIAFGASVRGLRVSSASVPAVSKP